MKIVRTGEEDFLDHWRTIWKASQYQYPLHTPLWGSFYKEQLVNCHAQDKSFIIVKANEPLFLILITELKNHENNTTLSWYGYPIVTIEKKQLTRKEKSAIRKILQEEIIVFAKKNEINLNFLDILTENRLSLMSENLIQSDLKQRTVFTQVINLKHTEQELITGLRKSYKGEIKWGKNNLQINIITADNLSSDTIEMFRKLHVSASRRETRPRVTWDLMSRMVANNEAFCVFGYYSDQLVSAAFFPVSEKLCFYGVSASNRDMWDKPLSHVLIWSAMIHAKKLGCDWLEMGELKLTRNVSAGDEQEEKELNISKFKVGFGGEKWLRLGMLTLEKKEI